MRELRWGASDDAKVVVRDVKDPYGDGFVDFVVDIRAPGLEATSYVRSLHGATGLAAFLDGLAARWRGWQGERTWNSLEHDLSVAAAHDGRGNVILRLTLRGSYRPDAWVASVSVEIEAGEELSRLSRDAHDFFGR